jgi:hypothetical protein
MQNPTATADIARVILDLHKNPEYLGFLRMVVADARDDWTVVASFRLIVQRGGRPEGDGATKVWNQIVRTQKKSQAQISRAWRLRNARQPGDGFPA